MFMWEGDLPGKNKPLASPETGLKLLIGIAEGDAVLEPLRMQS